MGSLLSMLLFSVKVNPLLGLIRNSDIISMLMLISELLHNREVAFFSLPLLRIWLSLVPALVQCPVQEALIKGNVILHTTELFLGSCLKYLKNFVCLVSAPY